MSRERPGECNICKHCPHGVCTHSAAAVVSYIQCPATRQYTYTRIRTYIHLCLFSFSHRLLCVRAHAESVDEFLISPRSFSLFLALIVLVVVFFSGLRFYCAFARDFSFFLIVCYSFTAELTLRAPYSRLSRASWLILAGNLCTLRAPKFLPRIHTNGKIYIMI